MALFLWYDKHPQLTAAQHQHRNGESHSLTPIHRLACKDSDGPITRRDNDVTLNMPKLMCCVNWVMPQSGLSLEENWIPTTKLEQISHSHCPTAPSGQKKTTLVSPSTHRLMLKSINNPIGVG